MATKIQLRRGTAAQWTSANPTLADGEIGYETDTGNIKVGTGVSGSGAWTSLPYYQLPNVSVNPATTADLNNALYRVMGRYRLNSVTGGTTTWTNAPSDFTVDADSVSVLLVTTHAYSSLTTALQQTLTQFSASNTTLQQWVRMYDGTNWTAWTSTAHLSDNEVTTAKIDTSAVTTAKIANDAVTTAKIASDAVTADKLADDVSNDANRAVTANHIQTSAVTTAKINDSAVTTAKIADSSSATTGVTYAKIQQAAANTVLGRSASTLGVVQEITCTAAGRALLDDASAADQRTTLGLGAVATLATVAPGNISGGIVNYTTNQVGAIVFIEVNHAGGTVSDQTIANTFTSSGASGYYLRAAQASQTWTVMPSWNWNSGGKIITGVTNTSTAIPIATNGTPTSGFGLAIAIRTA